MPAGPRPNPPSRVARLVYTGHYGGAPWANVMWLFLTGSGEITVADLNALADLCAYAWIQNPGNVLHTSVELENTQVVLYSDGDALEGLSDRIANGTNASDNPLPANVACCFSWHIVPSYRGGHPRTYVPGLVREQQASVNSWESGALDDLRAAASGWHEQLEEAGPVGDGIATVEHGVLSYVRANAWRVPPVFYRIVNSTVDNRIDTQRRRLGRDVA